MFTARFATFFVMIYLNIFQSGFGQGHNDVPHSYWISRSDYTFWTAFNLFDDDKSWGIAEKVFFHIEAHYDCFDRFGLYEGRAVCRLPSIDTLFRGITQIEIYDEYGEDVAMIEALLNAEEEKNIFHFINRNGDHFANGSLDKESSTVWIVDSSDSSQIFASFTRKSIGEKEGLWRVVMHQPAQVSYLIIKIFATFLCDNQDRLMGDSAKEEHSL